MHEQQTIEQVARRYADEGYDVAVAPKGEALPNFAAGFAVDLIARKPGDNVVVQVVRNRAELARDPEAVRLAEAVNAQSDWRLDLIVVQPETTTEKVVEQGIEPSAAEILRMIEEAKELEDAGQVASAYVFGWAAFEAAMRRVRDDCELYGRTTPVELLRTLYSNGMISEEEFRLLRNSFTIRTQLVHGLKVDPKNFAVFPVEQLSGLARKLLTGNEKATKVGA